MKAVFVMFDSLNRAILEPYGSSSWPDIKTPNFQRLAHHSTTFNTSYVGSMPCMPARRELHTARPNFLHRGWGPLEPFDDSMPQMLKEAGVHTALITDHQHYWEDGGATYHNRYSTWQHHRGQEGDPWMGQVAYEAVQPGGVGRNAVRPENPANAPIEYQDRINRKFLKNTADFSQQRTFAAGLDFIDRNARQDNWYLQLETFDPHEPFTAAPDYVSESLSGRTQDWPEYRELCSDDSDEKIAWYRRRYADLVRQCDANLGKVLDAFDRHGLWHDTILFVGTDHGFLLGEHDCWAKVHTLWWDDVARTPFFFWDPRNGIKDNQCDALVQPMLEIPVTLLNAFGVQPTVNMLGYDLSEIVENDNSPREFALFGQFGGHICVTDGRYVYMRAAANVMNQPLYEYTLMPTRMRSLFGPEELLPERCVMRGPFSFTKGAGVMRIDTDAGCNGHVLAKYPESLLFDTQADPQQKSPLGNDTIRLKMIEILRKAMISVDAPIEQWIRVGIHKK